MHIDAIGQVKGEMSETTAPAIHVAVIMDGNGRWAEARGFRVRACSRRPAGQRDRRGLPRLGVTHLTLYAFSTENWRRPPAEIDGLMAIFRRQIRGKMEGLGATTACGSSAGATGFRRGSAR